MSFIISSKLSKNKTVIRYYFEWGKSAGQRVSAGIFTYTKPKNAVEKNHNKEALSMLETKKSRMILEKQSISSGYIPAHKIKANFLDYYAEFVRNNRRYSSRHLMSSYNHFKTFLGSNYISAGNITENLCENFRAFLLKKFNGETPANYFREFKKIMKAAKKAGYFVENPVEDIACKTKANKIKKEVLEPQEYIQLLKTPCLNYDTRKAFIFCLYAGLRWCDVKTLKWENLKKDSIVLVQHKTLVEVHIPMHPTAQLIAGERKQGLIFNLPTADVANIILKQWVKDPGISKHITWHCARLSFSVLLQDEGVNTATVAGMLGHTSTKQVENTYKRYRIHIGIRAIQKLPSAEF
jgi:integrase/recombinase XerD